MPGATKIELISSLLQNVRTTHEHAKAADQARDAAYAAHKASLQAYGEAVCPYRVGDLLLVELPRGFRTMQAWLRVHSISSGRDWRSDEYEWHVRAFRQKKNGGDIEGRNAYTITPTTKVLEHRQGERKEQP